MLFSRHLTLTHFKVDQSEQVLAVLADALQIGYVFLGPVGLRRVFQ
jgi:hypothetical protein